MTYLVPTKPVLHSTTKIAGAARAASLSKSSVICRALLPKATLCGNTNRAGPPARYHITRRTKSLWTYAPPSPPLAKINDAFELMKARRVDPGRGDVLKWKRPLARAVTTKADLREGSPLFWTGIDDRPKVGA